MPQSNVIMAFVFAAFIVFVTQRGELPVYLGFLLATPKPSAAPTPSPATVATVAATAF